VNHGAQVASDGYNISDDGSCGFSAIGGHNSISSQPDPAGLSNNGGPTQTIAMMVGSPVIDVIPLVSPNGQRGTRLHRRRAKPDNIATRDGCRARLGALVAAAFAACSISLVACGTNNTSSAKPAVSNSKTPHKPGETVAPLQFAPATRVAPATVAVADFEGGSIPPERTTEFWGKALASFMIADLAATQNLRLIDREHLAEVLREQMISATDLADPRTRVQVGKILGAKYFIFGTYTIVGGQAALTARMDWVETGQIVQADSVSGDEADMRELSQQLAAKFLRPLDQVVAEQEMHPPVHAGGPPAEALQYFSRGIGYEKSGDYDRSIDMFTRALTIYPHYAEARTELEKASESAARQQ
jgi:TolB-like protein